MWEGFAQDKDENGNMAFFPAQIWAPKGGDPGSAVLYLPHQGDGGYEGIGGDYHWDGSILCGPATPARWATR